MSKQSNTQLIPVKYPITKLESMNVLVSHPCIDDLENLVMNHLADTVGYLVYEDSIGYLRLAVMQYNTNKTLYYQRRDVSDVTIVDFNKPEGSYFDLDGKVMNLIKEVEDYYNDYYKNLGCKVVDMKYVGVRGTMMLTIIKVF